MEAPRALQGLAHVVRNVFDFDSHDADLRRTVRCRPSRPDKPVCGAPIRCLMYSVLFLSLLATSR